MKGWSKIVAFHTRNVSHKGHEYVIREAVERANADGLFVHPVIGPKKTGDFVPEAILGVYDRLIEESLPGTLLGAFMTYPRYCGPREAELWMYPLHHWSRSRWCWQLLHQ